MARPLFVVQHLVACTDVVWVGAPGPAAPRNLFGVSYEYRVSAAFPVAFPLWLYARFFLTNGRDGKRKFDADLYWIDAPVGQTQWVATYQLGPVLFAANEPVVNAAWRLTQCTFPGRGRFEFRLMCNFEPDEDGFDVPLAVEPILSE